MREEGHGAETQDGDECPDTEVPPVDTETALPCAVAFGIDILNVGRERAHGKNNKEIRKCENRTRGASFDVYGNVLIISGRACRL